MRSKLPKRNVNESGGDMSKVVTFIRGVYDKEGNKYGKPRQSQTFCFNGKYYWADLNTISKYEPETECMIFPSDENGCVTDWTEVYCRRGIDVTRKNLLECIHEFVTVGCQYE